MKTPQTFSILIWANKGRMIKGQIPLYARVTVDGKRSEISLKKRVDASKWDPENGVMTGTSEDVKIINSHITHVKSELFKIYTQMQMLDEFITAEGIKRSYTGEKQEKRAILQVFDYHNEQMEKIVGIDVTKPTLIKFKTIRLKLSKFILHQYKRSDFYLEELSYQFLSNFEFYLKTVEKIGHNTTMKYVQNLKKIVHLAVKNDWLTKDPFSNFKCSFRKVERDVLTIQELEKIEKKKFKVTRLDIVKDLFIFSCYTGLAYIDVMQLSPENLNIGIDGELWIFTHRHKTNERVRIPLLDKAKAIIEKYKKNPVVLNSGGLLPRLSNQKLNSYLKEIADLCEIDKNLTFHLARHTFATTVTLANGVPIETVSKLLGHSSIKTTQIYAKVIEKKVSEDMNVLKSKLNPVVNKKKLRKI